MRAFAKKDFPVSKVRRFLEPGPIVLVSSAWKGKTNIMIPKTVLLLKTAPLAALLAGYAVGHFVAVVASLVGLLLFGLAVVLMALAVFWR